MSFLSSLAEMLRTLQAKPPEQPPSPTLSEPWRKTSWGDRDRDLEYVQNYKPEKEGINHLRILLYGPVGAGKSSFINSVHNVIRGRMTTPALVNSGNIGRSFTKKFDIHKIPKGRGRDKTFYPLVFCDLMGLEEDSGHGVQAEDIKLALRGHVEEGYLFNPISSLQSGSHGYKECPSLDDKVHVLVCVLSANMTDIKESHLQKMANIREAASDLGIPQMAIITNVDEACTETKKNLKNVYKSKHLKKKMKTFSTTVGIPLNCVFPVKNYCDEAQLDDNVDCLILSALRTMVNFGDDFIENM